MIITNMKSLGALLLLGAANYASAQSADYQDLRTGGHVNYGVFNGATRKLIKQSDGRLKVEGFSDGDNLRVICEKASSVVRAWDNVGDSVRAFQHQIPDHEVTPDIVRGAGSKPDTSGHSKSSVLVYACKVEKEVDTGVWSSVPINSATNEDENGVTSSVAIQGSFVRVHYGGSCDKQMDTETTFVTQIRPGEENYGKRSDYTAPLTMEAVFPCIEPMGFEKKVVFDLQYKPTDEAKDAGIIDDAVTTGEVDFTKVDRLLTGDGKTFTMSYDAKFNLGADKPHPAYYESGVDGCEVGSQDESLCKGGLKATLSLNQTVKAHSVATQLVDYQTIGTGFKFKPCFNKPSNPLDGTNIYEHLEACYGSSVRNKVKSWTSATNSAKKNLQTEVAALVLEERTSTDNYDEAGAGSLLTDMICPFTCPDGAANCPLSAANTDDSTSLSALECLHVGVKTVDYTPEFWDNRCEARTDGKDDTTDPTLAEVLAGDEYQQALRSPYEFTYKFSRGTGNQKQFVDPDAVNFKEYTVDLHSNEIRHDVIMNLTRGDFNDLISNAAFFTVEGDGFVQEVSLNTNTLTIRDVPTYVKTLTLKGQVFTSCKRTKEVLSNAMAITIGQPLLKSGVFKPKNASDPCNTLFVFDRDGLNTDSDHEDAYSVTGVLRGDTFEATPGLVKMCDEDPAVATATSCNRASYNSIQVKSDFQDPVALLEGLCDVNGFPRKAGVIGALVAFGDNRAYAPVICPGTCTEATIHDVSLDWDIELAVSANDNPVGATAKSDSNKLIARQETSDWGDDELDTATPKNRYYDLERVAYLTPVSRDDCQLDGTLSIDDDSIPTNSDTTAGGCLVYKRFRSKTAAADWGTATEYSGIVKAADMVEWFKECGSQTALGAEVHLVQRFKVTYGDDRDISFCQTKKLSVTVQETMVGESTQTLTTVQQEDSDDAASIVATLKQVQYTDDGCDIDGTYRLRATTDIATSVDITADHSKSPIDFQTLRSGWNSADKVFTWSTECLDICDSQSAKLDTLSDPLALKVELDEVAGGSGAGLDIEFTIDMEGSPCGENDQVDKATAELTLYNAGPPAAGQSEVACTNNNGEYDALASNQSKFKSPRALTDVVCGRLNVTGLGDSKLYIMRTKLTRQLPGSAAELLCQGATDETDAANGEPCVGDVRNVMFAPSGANGLNETVEDSGHFIKFADSSIKLVADDAFATIRYTIFWEQRLAGRRRLLRSDMILGAGEKSAKGELIVLPVSEQIQDAVESLDSEPAGSDSSDASDDSADSDDDGLSGGAIAGIVAGSAAGVGLIAYVAYTVQQSGGLGNVLLGNKSPSANGYKTVRRSERFSTMNF